ncbi:hypothetical protein CLV56_0172 [Mumia flava]|uniref:DUF2613 family protein n=1 Tax=Mumia flava TaxID=1348852 RepID=A0A2M9BDG0_9ACTN|nr:hypothetical protein [Mumia flava]PJJ55969.1 hypothetical protein CLV56_0172 [Mumia flava]
MGSVITGVVALIAGAALAGATVVGVVSVNSESSPAEPQTQVVPYGAGE